MRSHSLTVLLVKLLFDRALREIQDFCEDFKANARGPLWNLIPGYTQNVTDKVQGYRDHLNKARERFQVCHSAHLVTMFHLNPESTIVLFVVQSVTRAIASGLCAERVDSSYGETPRQSRRITYAFEG